MKRILVGKVSEEEKDRILTLFKRKSGLLELAKILTADNSDIYEKMVTDLGKTTIDFNDWWNEMSNKYLWEGHVDCHWNIDFEDGSIYLEPNNE